MRDSERWEREAGDSQTKGRERQGTHRERGKRGGGLIEGGRPDGKNEGGERGLKEGA